MVIQLEPEKTRKEIIKELRKFFAQANTNQHKLDEKNIGKSLLDAAINVTGFAANIQSLLSPENIIGVALVDLLTKA